ncbi:hypothetical protein [Methylobacterium oxalidis]|uniref:Uncharacterized protein n=1 Tax=Methylobacterium oxalidis TaxID=944322 RepID=A0A512J905_9HYPH|nr:hypothetical protein [Methylobacterium oxalidis]GEP06441.1 hypothetical protein MOX02_44790 [Methylobacterium oxalidis]GJE33533.1 hypothetical protein LDDCCGHA_3733 [Methylobacterium oxalidis]GLS65481.1 hypothetical protein GCM10007888_38630 [Methylobacterium oxalidis]
MRAARFADHPAFQPNRPRVRQVEDLNNIRAVLPLEAAEACLAVWRAMHLASAVPIALRELEALPEETRAHVITMSAAIAGTHRRAA